MSRWFRLYSEVVNDPKVQRLPCEDFRAWINLLCLCAENDGKVPSIADVSFSLRMPENAVVTLIERLSNGGLIDRCNGGANGWHYAPHGWDKRQYKSDTSTERVKRFRESSATVSVTPPETEADTEQNIEAKASSSTASKRSPGLRDFDRFWSAYPAKVGKKAAERAWVKSKDKPPIEDVLSALEAYRLAKPKDRDWCHPTTWISQGRWGDQHEVTGAIAAKPVEVDDAFMASRMKILQEMSNAQ